MSTTRWNIILLVSAAVLPACGDDADGRRDEPDGLCGDRPAGSVCEGDGVCASDACLHGSLIYRHDFVGESYANMAAVAVDATDHAVATFNLYTTEEWPGLGSTAYGPTLTRFSPEGEALWAKQIATATDCPCDALGHHPSGDVLVYARADYSHPLGCGTAENLLELPAVLMRFDATTGQEVSSTCLPSSPGYRRSALFDPQGELYVFEVDQAGDPPYEQRLRSYDATGAMRIDLLLPIAEECEPYLSMSPSGALIALLCAQLDGELLVFDGQGALKSHQQTSLLHAVAIADDEQIVAAADHGIGAIGDKGYIEDPTVAAADVGGKIRAVQFDAAGHLVIVGGSDIRTRLIKREANGAPIYDREVGAEPVVDSVYAPPNVVAVGPSNKVAIAQTWAAGDVDDLAWVALFNP